VRGVLAEFREFVLRGNLVDLAIAAVVFFAVVKPVNALLARMKRDEQEEPEAPAPDVALLTEIRDLLRDRG
jgi:large conductance mechanosensitive channel